MSGGDDEAAAAADDDVASNVGGGGGGGGGGWGWGVGGANSVVGLLDISSVLHGVWTASVCRLPDDSSIYTPELRAILLALKHVCYSKENRF